MTNPLAQTFVWSGGEHPFFLAVGELRALQKICDAGPMWIFVRMSAQKWLIDDITATIRLGLIGGGMDDKEARELVNEHVEEARAGFYKHVLLAQNILQASLFEDDEDDPVGETPAVNEENVHREEK